MGTPASGVQGRDGGPKPTCSWSGGAPALSDPGLPRVSKPMSGIKVSILGPTTVSEQSDASYLVSALGPLRSAQPIGILHGSSSHLLLELPGSGRGFKPGSASVSGFDVKDGWPVITVGVLTIAGVWFDVARRATTTTHLLVGGVDQGQRVTKTANI